MEFKVKTTCHYLYMLNEYYNITYVHFCQRKTLIISNISHSQLLCLQLMSLQFQVSDTISVIADQDVALLANDYTPFLLSCYTKSCLRCDVLSIALTMTSRRTRRAIRTKPRIIDRTYQSLFQNIAARIL